MSPPPTPQEALMAPVPGTTAVVPTATSDKCPSLPASKAQVDVAISIAPTSAAADEALVSRLVAIINTAFDTSEGDLWIRGAPLRTDPAEVARYISAGELCWAWTTPPILQYPSTSPSPSPNLPPSDPQSLVGCMTLFWHQDHCDAAPVPNLGMLACDTAHLGAGVGRALIAFGEGEAKRRGARASRIELMAPRDGSHPSKKRLEEWYRRAGYVRVAEARLEDKYPFLVGMSTKPLYLQLFDKEL